MITKWQGGQSVYIAPGPGFLRRLVDQHFKVLKRFSIFFYQFFFFFLGGEIFIGFENEIIEGSKITLPDPEKEL